MPNETGNAYAKYLHERALLVKRVMNCGDIPDLLRRDILVALSEGAPPAVAETVCEHDFPPRPGFAAFPSPNCPKCGMHYLDAFPGDRRATPAQPEQPVKPFREQDAMYEALSRVGDSLLAIIDRRLESRHE